jgi:hypothetical protein
MRKPGNTFAQRIARSPLIHSLAVVMAPGLHRVFRYKYGFCKSPKFPIYLIRAIGYVANFAEQKTQKLESAPRLLPPLSIGREKVR